MAPLGAFNFSEMPGDRAETLTKIEVNVREATSQGVNLVAFLGR